MAEPYPSSSSEPSGASNFAASSFSLKASVPEFISKLYLLLQNPQNVEIVTWGAEGESFVILDINEFSRSILPRHFKHSNFSSFVRQLNKYDFHKVKNNARADEDAAASKIGQVWEFFHPFFKRDEIELLTNIKRKKSSETAPPYKGKMSFDYGSGGSSSMSAACDGMSGDASSSLMDEVCEMHDQIGSIAKMQNDMALALQVVSKNYQALIDEYCVLRRQVSEHDRVLRMLVSNSRPAEARFPPATSGPLAPLAQMLPSAASLGKITPPSMGMGAGGAGQQLLPSTASISSASALGVAVENALIENQLRNMQAQSLLHSQSTSQSQTPSTSASPSPVLAKKQHSVEAPFAPSPHSLLALGSVSSHEYSSSESLSDPSYLRSGSGANSASGIRSRSPATASPNIVHWKNAPRVLLVDDDVICRKLSTKILEYLGCITDVCVDGDDAVRMMDKNAYDIVFMDIVMPNVDGLTATKRIRKSGKSTPIIAMTSNVSQNDCIQYISTGMSDILPKPFSRELIFNLLEKYCKHLK